MVTIATVQCHVAPDVHANGREIRVAMERAARAGARLAHFPEAALSGYPHRGDTRRAAHDWHGLAEEMEATIETARRLGLWVVLGANHRLPGRRRPHNSLHVISDRGVAVGRYDKRMCSSTETSLWYTPGHDPLAFELDGVRFGCAICIEVVFPQLFAAYARDGVDCVLLSAYSPDPIHGVMAQAHAATNCVWLSLSTPVSCSLGLPAAQYGPDGHRIASARPGVPEVLLHRIDREAPAYHVALRHARPWRARALSGAAYALDAVQANSDATPVLAAVDELSDAFPASIR